MISNLVVLEFIVRVLRISLIEVVFVKYEKVDGSVVRGWRGGDVEDRAEQACKGSFAGG